MQAQAQLRLEAIYSQFLSFHLLVIASYLLSISFYLFQLSFSFFGHLLHIPNLFYILLFFGTIFFSLLFCFVFVLQATRASPCLRGAHGVVASGHSPALT